MSHNLEIRSFFYPEYPNGLNRDLVYKRIIKLFIPAAVEYALLQVTTMFDQIQVGGVGKEALAAVGLASQISGLLITLFIAINIGLTANIAKTVGAGYIDKISDYVRNGLFLSLCFALPVSFLGFIFAKPLLIIFNAPDPITLRYGTEYIKVLMIGFIPLALTTSFTASLRGVGNTRLPMIYNLTSNILNIILNWVLIGGKLGMPALGVLGAGIATVCGHFAGFFLACLFCFKKNNLLKLKFSALFGKLDILYLKQLLNIGFPAMLERSISKLGIAVFTAIVASLGTSLYATHVICLNIQLLTGMSGQAFSVVSTTLAGQSIGSKRTDLAVLYTNCTAKLSLIIAIVLMGIYFFGGPSLISLYNSDRAIIEYGAIPLKIVAMMQPFAAFQYVLAGAMRGAGDTKSVALCYTFAQLVCRPLFAFLAINYLGLGLNGAWLSLAISESLCAVLLMSRYNSGKWAKI